MNGLHNNLESSGQDRNRHVRLRVEGMLNSASFLREQMKKYLSVKELGRIVQVEDQ